MSNEKEFKMKFLDTQERQAKALKRIADFLEEAMKKEILRPLQEN